MFHTRGQSTSRRTFLRATAAGTVGLALAGQGQAHAATRPVPPWFDQDKFGIFIHWNAAAIPAYAPVHTADLEAALGADAPKWRQEQQWRLLPYAEMYQNTMNVPGSETARFHAQNYSGRTYDDFVGQFRDRTLAGWNPRPWADLFAKAGAKYVVVTAKTEDGFLLWPSQNPNPHKRNWQAKRDVIGDLAKAVRRKGMRFGTYLSTGMDWTFGGLPVTDNESFLNALLSVDLGYTGKHWQELIDRYDPSVLWSDYGFLPWKEAATMLTNYTKKVPDGVVNDRFDGEAAKNGTPVDFKTVEYSTDYPDPRKVGKWEACRGIGTSFGYNRLETDASYLTSEQLVHLLVDVVSQGGNLLLNVGPTGSGHIPREQERRLRELGGWLEDNGRAIYGTTYWKRAKGLTTEGREVRYTRSKDAVNAIVLGEPNGNAVDLDVKLADHATVELLGEDGKLRWERSPQGTRISLPGRRNDQYALSLRLSPASAVADPTS